jgi:4-hydroxy-tetrahydrodipicolinate reductase
MDKNTIAILGARGRMGQLLQSLAQHDAAWQPIAVGRGDDASIAMARAQVAVDFTHPAISVQHATWAAELQKPIVIGTTGLDAGQMQALRDAARRTAIFYARNFSLGIHVLRQLLAQAARDLPPDYQIAITEAHHAHKKDAPSGTGLALAETVVAARGGAVPPIHALRLGGVIGDHAVHFANAQEIITLEHRALDRAVFAAGALRAAQWILHKPPGFYGMEDLVNG